MAANPLAGEAELFVGGKLHLVKVNMRAIPLMCKAVGVETWTDLGQVAQKVTHIEALTRALLDANRIEVTDDEIADMDWQQWFDAILPALLRFSPKKDEDGANPPKSRAKK